MNIKEKLNNLDLNISWGNCKTNSEKIVKAIKGSTIHNPFIAHDVLSTNGGHYFVVYDNYVIDYVMHNQSAFKKLNVKEYDKYIYDKKDYYNKLEVN